MPFLCCLGAPAVKEEAAQDLGTLAPAAIATVQEVVQAPAASHVEEQAQEIQQPTSSQTQLQRGNQDGPAPGAPEPAPSAPAHPKVRSSLEALVSAGMQRTPLHVGLARPQDLVKDVHDLRWIGQGSQGIVYEGIWQGATVAVKWSIGDQMDVGACELLFSRLLSHPNVVQTYDAKVAVLDAEVFQRAETHSSSSSTAIVPADNQLQLDRAGSNSTATATTTGGQQQQQQQQQQPALWQAHQRTAAVPGQNAAQGGGVAGVHGFPGTQQQQQNQPPQLQRSLSFQSDEGFGDPLGRPSSLTDVRDMLHLIGAKPGQHLTQMIMEFCDQGSLLTAIARGIFLPTGRFGSKVAIRALYRTAREVAQGMVHLHSAQVVHGDLKPANVLLMNSRKDRRGFVARVSDFGLAQYCPTAGCVLDAPWGTLVFMAPERFRHNILTPASDVWSFGVMLWQMYTAKMPYEGTRQAQLMLGITTNTLHLNWPENSPTKLVSLAQACMAYAPQDRPTFEQLMHELAVLESDVRLEGVRLSFSLDTLQQQHSGLSNHGAPSNPGTVAIHAAGAQARTRMSGQSNGGAPAPPRDSMEAAAAAARAGLVSRVPLQSAGASGHFTGASAGAPGQQHQRPGSQGQVAVGAATRSSSDQQQQQQRGQTGGNPLYSGSVPQKVPSSTGSATGGSAKLAQVQQQDGATAQQGGSPMRQAALQSSTGLQPLKTKVISLPQGYAAANSAALSLSPRNTNKTSSDFPIPGSPGTVVVDGVLVVDTTSCSSAQTAHSDFATSISNACVQLGIQTMGSSCELTAAMLAAARGPSMRGAVGTGSGHLHSAEHQYKDACEQLNASGIQVLTLDAATPKHAKHSTDASKNSRNSPRGPVPHGGTAFGNSPATMSVGSLMSGSGAPARCGTHSSDGTTAAASTAPSTAAGSLVGTMCGVSVGGAGNPAHSQHLTSFPGLGVASNNPSGAGPHLLHARSATQQHLQHHHSQNQPSYAQVSPQGSSTTPSLADVRAAVAALQLQQQLVPGSVGYQRGLSSDIARFNRSSALSAPFTEDEREGESEELSGPQAQQHRASLQQHPQYQQGSSRQGGRVSSGPLVAPQGTMGGNRGVAGQHQQQHQQHSTGPGSSGGEELARMQQQSTPLPVTPGQQAHAAAHTAGHQGQTGTATGAGGQASDAAAAAAGQRRNSASPMVPVTAYTHGPVAAANTGQQHWQQYNNQGAGAGNTGRGNTGAGAGNVVYASGGATTTTPGASQAVSSTAGAPPPAAPAGTGSHLANRDGAWHRASAWAYSTAMGLVSSQTAASVPQQHTQRASHTQGAKGNAAGGVETSPAAAAGVVPQDGIVPLIVLPLKSSFEATR